MDLDITGKRLVLGGAMVAIGLGIIFVTGRLFFAETETNGWLLCLAWHVGSTLTGAGIAMPVGNKWVLLIGAVVGFLFAAIITGTVLLIVWIFIAPNLGGG
jgi:hypothetical protein